MGAIAPHQLEEGRFGRGCALPQHNSGDGHANALPGLAVRGSHAEEESRIHGGRGADTGRGDRRKRRGF